MRIILHFLFKATFIENKIKSESTNGQWLAIVRKESNYDTSLENRMYEFIDFSIAKVRFQIFDTDKNVSDKHSISSPSTTMPSITESSKQDSFENAILNTARHFDLDAKKNFIHIVSALNRLDFVQHLCDEKKIDPNLKEEKTLRTPIMFAVMNNSFDVFKWLVEEKKVDTNAVDYEGNGLVHLFIQFNPKTGESLTILKYLIDVLKFDLNAKNNFGKSIMQMQGIDENLEISKYLKDQLVKSESSKPFDLVTFFSKALENRDLRMLIYLIEIRETDLYYRFDSNRTFLHYSTHNDLISFARYLTEKGLSPNIQDSFGVASIHLVKSVEMLDLFVSYNGDLYLTDLTGKSIIHYVAKQGSVDLMKHLVKNYRIDPNLPNKYLSRPIHFAVVFGHMNLFSFLVDDLKVKLNEKNILGYTALRESVFYNRIPMVKVSIQWRDFKVNSIKF